MSLFAGRSPLSPIPEPKPPKHGPHLHRPGQDRRPVRAYSTFRGERDIDQYERALKLRIFFFSIVGLVLGGLLGLFGVVTDSWGRGTAAVIALVGWASSYFVPLWITNLSGKAAGILYNPSGATTPHRKEYSHAESLVARGDYGAAIAAFELAVSEDGSDPAPYLSVARVYRDRLGRLDEAASWFRRTLRDSDLDPGLAILTRKELVELYEHRMGEPLKAVPVLAQMAEELSGTTEGVWAAEELVRLKSIVRASDVDEA